MSSLPKAVTRSGPAEIRTRDLRLRIASERSTVKPDRPLQTQDESIYTAPGASISLRGKNTGKSGNTTVLSVSYFET